MSRKIGRIAVGLGLALLVAAATAAAGEPGPGAVLQYHGNAARTGSYVIPGLTWAKARQLHRDSSFHAPVAAPVRAQPLYVAPKGGKPFVVVASENNIVEALRASTGTVLWRRQVGSPVPLAHLPCGDIDPLGITGTPAIDPAGTAVYFDAMVGAEGGARHRIFGLSLANGHPLKGFPIDVQDSLKAEGKMFDAIDQNERGAVAIVNGRVYVAYSGLDGDCGAYRGWVVSAPLHPPGKLESWATRATGGGIWGPGGVLSDGKSVFVATGNTMGASSWSGGEAVVRLNLHLGFTGRHADFFTPTNWHDLDDQDLDLGGSSPVLFTAPGISPSKLALALGKDGKAYLLNQASLGGIGGALAVRQVSSDEIRTGAAVYYAGGRTLVAFQGTGDGCPGSQSGDLTVLKIVPGRRPSIAIAWCAAANGLGSPIVTTTDGRSNPIVWIVGAEGDNRLHGYRGDTGATLFAGGGSAEAMQVLRFETPIAAGRRLYVGGQSEVYAFTF